ncbi:hypothetical protein [Acinetobacter sp. YH12147]|uniref:hypothetical protein n=1 Tax=Acinetobacter sp. YH12147 TaxID=2601130 RepID=UPI0015D1EF4A|nr:hypothetical protein [Acinetobacter sp. YH12147]
MIVEKKINQFFLFFAFMLPFLLVYFFIFILSMDTALDRLEYIKLMNVDLKTRVEPMLPLVSSIFDPLISEPFYKLITIQFVFFILFLVSLFNYFNPNDLNSLAKTFFALLLCLIVFSNPLGVQLRIGYATILFIFIIINFKKPYFFLIIPLFMHYGVVFAILFFIYFSIFNINNKWRFIYNSFFSLLSLTVFFIYIEDFFRMIGVSAYYYNYLNEENSFGRSFPYSVIFYLMICCLLLYFFKDKKDKYFWFSLSGLWLVYVGFVLDFYLAFKMLVPISLFALIYLLKFFPNERNPYIYLIAAYIFSPLAFLYFAIQVDII